MKKGGDTNLQVHEDRAEAEENQRFVKYLFQLLLHSGENICLKCAYLQPNGLCHNFNMKRNIIMSDSICYDGMKEFFEKDEALR